MLMDNQHSSTPLCWTQQAWELKAMQLYCSETVKIGSEASSKVNGSSKKAIIITYFTADVVTATTVMPWEPHDH